MPDKQSIEDTYKYYFNLNKNYIFREFYKVNENYIATNNFYVSDEVDDGRLEFHNNIIKITPFNNIYMEINNKKFYKNYINLILISNISFSLYDINIKKIDIIKKFIENDIEIEEKLLEDLYYNKNFSNKIKINIPDKFYNLNGKEDINKKYLFKINIKELNNIIEQENIQYVG